MVGDPYSAVLLTGTSSLISFLLYRIYTWMDACSGPALEFDLIPTRWCQIFHTRCRRVCSVEADCFPRCNEQDRSLFLRGRFSFCDCTIVSLSPRKWAHISSSHLVLLPIFPNTTPFLPETPKSFSASCSIDGGGLH